MTRPSTSLGSARKRVGLVLLLATSVIVPLSLFLPLRHAGLWDPFELEVAEFGRRIGAKLFGNDGLLLVGAENLLPIQRELGRGELPFTSVGLGFAVFGLHPWAGRLPLALWALVGVVASAGLSLRLGGRRAALTTALALATTPLYFVQAQVMLGLGVAMSGFALALWGMVELCWPREPERWWMALAWGTVAGLGLIVGVLSQGMVLGIAVPTLGVGLAWFLGRPREEHCGRVAAAWVCLGLGLLSGLGGAVATWRAIGADYSAIVGLSLRLVPTGATHDEIWRLLGHALFPWTGLGVLAYGLLVGAAERDEPRGHPPVAALLMAPVILALGVHGLFAIRTGPTGFIATPAIAVAIGVAFSSLEDHRFGSRVMAMVFVAVTAMIGLDLSQEPARCYAALAIGEQVVPESFLREARRWVLGATGLCAVGTYLALHESTRSRRRPFHARDYRAWLETVWRLSGGDVALGLGLAEIALMALALGKTISDRGAHWGFFEQTFGIWAALIRFGWILLPIGVFGVPLGALLLRDLGRWLFEPARVPSTRAPSRTSRWEALVGGRPNRVEGAVLSCAMAGACFSLGLYPGMMRQASPAGAFAAYEAAAKRGEPLALLGTNSAVAPYLVGRDAPSFESSSEAFSWLVGGSERRFLILDDSELPALNFAFRQRVSPPANLPVLDSTSSRIRLASSALLPGERNVNPVESIVLASPPPLARRIPANLGDQLEIVGWEIRSAGGRVEESIVPGSNYVLRLCWRVLEPPSQEWTTFVHIDGRGRRHIGDHEPLEGRYPSEYWQRGDYLVDDHQFSLEPNFAPGVYQLYFGFFRGSQRLPVKIGQHHENRVIGGAVQVR